MSESYYPYRQVILSRDELRELSTLRPLVAIRGTAWNWLVILKKTFWGGYHIPRHWTLFDEKSLRHLFEAAGFKVISLSYQTGHSFWMYSFHHIVKYKLRMPRLARWFDPLIGMPFLIAFTGLDIVRRTLGFRTSAMLLIAQKPERA